MRPYTSWYFALTAAANTRHFRNAISIGAAVVLLIVFFVAMQQTAKHVEQPVGCDDFGYLRQARLFARHGMADGLATAITDPLTRAVVDLVKATGEPPEAWQEGVAPHCHHYKPAVDRIVLQYPPGTGALLSLFPEGIQARTATRILALLLLAGLLAAVLHSRTALGMAAVTMLGVGLFKALGWHASSLSIPGSLAAAVALGWLVAAKLDFSGRAANAGWHALAGLVLGLSVAVRIPNVFMAAGFGACYGAALLQRPRLTGLAGPAAFSIAFALGVLPVLLANAVNAGSLFATTYGTADAARPVLDAATLAEGLHYFLVENARTRFVVGGAALLLAGLALVQFRRPDARSGFVLLAAGVNLMTNLGYFVLHDPRASYYPIPLAAFVATAAAFALRHRVEQGFARAAPLPRPEVELRRIVGGCALVAGLVASAAIRTPVSPLFSSPEMHRAFDAKTLVWADLTTGYFHYFQHRQASKLIFAAPNVQERLVDAASREGYTQAVIVDSSTSAALAAKLEREGRAIREGQAYGYDVYVVAPRSR